MKHFTLLITFCLLASTAFAQYENLDLKKYKLPEMKRHQLDFNFDSDGSMYYNTYTSEYSDERTNSKDADFSGGGTFDYSYYKNSLKFQTVANASTNLHYSKQKKSNTNSTQTEESDFTTGLWAYYDLKYFMGESNWFLSATPNAYVNFSEDKDFIDDTHLTSKSVGGNIGIGAGLGRIEQVQDYRHAILLLQELEKRGLSKRQLNEEEVLAFSALISDLKNKRVFDARNRKQTDLEAIHAFLIEKGVVDENMNMNYFVGLEDIWVFGALQIRESGKQLKLMGSPGYSVFTYADTADRKLEYFEVSSALTYQISKPISLKWQSDYYFSFNNRYLDKITEDNFSYGVSKYYSQLYAGAGLGFFPNTRTALKINGFTYVNNSSDQQFFDDEAYDFTIRINANAYYYISERFRVEGGISFQNVLEGVFNEDINNYNRNYFSYHLNLSYAIY